MKRVWLVLRNELINVVARRSFILTTLGIPLLSTLIFMGASALNRRAAGGAAAAISQIVGGGAQPQAAEGFVDPGGIIKIIPSSVPDGRLVRYPDEAAARQALAEGKITAFYIIPADYLKSGKLTNVRADFNPFSGFSQAGLLQWVLKVNLLGGDVGLGSLVDTPLDLEVTSLAPTPERDQNNPLTFWLPYAVTFIFYLVILMTASLLLSSLTKEKENRVLEILMASIDPLELLVGKITALGLSGLLQTVLWVSTGYVLLRLSGQAFALPAAFQLPASIILWGVVFFLLGYAVYASLMAAIGALVPNLREASQATFIIILPMIVPMMMISVLVEEPNGALAVGLSLFPLTAPVTMMTRLSAGAVPVWQVLLAVVLLAGTAVFIVRGVARLFRAQTLLTGQKFQLRRLFAALAGRE
jgi:ABC-2 type transport system permease protein